MDQATYDPLPDRIAARELRVRAEPAGFRVDEPVPVTTRLDPVESRKEGVATRLFQRWDVEPDPRAIKDEMQREVLRCQTPEMARHGGVGAPGGLYCGAVAKGDGGRGP